MNIPREPLYLEEIQKKIKISAKRTLTLVCSWTSHDITELPTKIRVMFESPAKTTRGVAYHMADEYFYECNWFIWLYGWNSLSAHHKNWMIEMYKHMEPWITENQLIGEC